MVRENDLIVGGTYTYADSEICTPIVITYTYLGKEPEDSSRANLALVTTSPKTSSRTSLALVTASDTFLPFNLTRSKMMTRTLMRMIGGMCFLTSSPGGVSVCQRHSRKRSWKSSTLWTA
jgi:hypothetical protein